MLLLVAMLLSADPKACAKDADCTLQNSCKGCNRCYSAPFPAANESDCEADCKPAALACACVAKQCTEVPKPVKHWVLWREGKQCQLRAKTEVEKEKQRLAPAVAEVWATYSLDPSLVPAACVPKKRFGPKPMQVCQACGCPETWYFCAASASDLSSLGYTRVE